MKPITYKNHLIYKHSDTEFEVCNPDNSFHSYETSLESAKKAVDLLVENEILRKKISKGIMDNSVQKENDRIMNQHFWNGFFFGACIGIILMSIAWFLIHLIFN